ncbi:MAG: hypothetical protein RL429_1158 [Bacteroidota bacterium]
MHEVPKKNLCTSLESLVDRSMKPTLRLQLLYRLFLVYPFRNPTCGNLNT